MTSLTAFRSTTKVALLMAGLAALFGAAGHAVAGPTGLLVALGLAAATNVAMYVWSSTLVLRMFGARVVTEAEAPALIAMVDRLRRRAGLAMPAVAIAPHAQPNTFATGRGERAAVVCVTEGLLASMEREELEGVIAHELAHIKQGDMLLMTIVATLAGAVSNLGNIALFSPLLGTRDEDGERSWVGQLVPLIVAPLAAMLIQLTISRQREFRADALGASIAGRPDGLARALVRLDAMARAIPLAASPASHRVNGVMRVA